MNRKGISTAFIIFALFIPFLVSAYVSPGKPSGFVNDFANIVSDSEQVEMENILSNFEKQNSVEIAVVTVQSLGDEDIDGYAVKLFEDWGIGKADKDNGLLMIFAMDERKMRIEVGYGLEPYITDAISSNIRIKILTPAFQSGQYSKGIKEAVTTIIKILNGDIDSTGNIISGTEYGYGEDSSSSFDSNSDQYMLPAFWALFFFMWLTSILGRSRSWWLGGVMGGIFGIIVSFIYFTLIIDILFTIIMIIIGLFFDFVVSRVFSSSISSGTKPPWWVGGGSLGGGGGFGGFGGGGSGGGGSSGGW